MPRSPLSRRLSRRQFVSNLGKAAGAIALPSIIPATALGRGGRPAPSSRVVLAAVGMYQGLGVMSGFLADPRVQVVGIGELKKDRMQKGIDRVKSAYGPNATVTGTEDLFEFLNRDDIDAMMFALPDHWHAIPVIAAAKRRKHVYTEKPVAQSIGEARAMVNAVQRSGITCQVGSQQRSSVEFRRAVDLVRAGAIGDVKTVEVGLPGGAGPKLPEPFQFGEPPPGFNYERWIGPAPWAPFHDYRCYGPGFGNWRWQFDYGGGQLTDWIEHHCDIAMWALGLCEPGVVKIDNASAKFAEGPLYNTAYEYRFDAHFGNGTVIQIGSTPLMRGGVTFRGTEGWIYVTRGEIDFSSPSIRNYVIPASANPLPPIRGHQSNFIDCIYSGDEPVCPIHEATRVVTVAHLANAAFRSGLTELTWDPVAERLVNAPEAARFLARAYRPPWKLEA